MSAKQTFAKIRLALMFSAEHKLPIELGSDEIFIVLEELDQLASETRKAIVCAEAGLARHIIAYNEEVDQFNEGYVAGEKGGLDPFNDQPHYEPDHDSWRNGYYAGSYDRLTRELAALKERTRWILVGERLPIEPGYVLAVVQGDDEVCWYNPETQKFGYFDVDWITHWMPLPESPEEK